MIKEGLEYLKNSEFEKAYLFLKFILNSLSLIIDIDDIFSTNELYGLSTFLLIKSTVNFTSLEVNMVPSCHLISFNLIFTDKPSFNILYSFTNCGTIS